MYKLIFLCKLDHSHQETKYIQTPNKLRLFKFIFITIYVLFSLQYLNN